MTDVLSAAEIDALLTAISANEKELEDFRPRADYRKIKIYDFKRPDKFNKEQIRTISIIHESFSRMMSTYLQQLLRLPSHIHVASVDQLTYEEFIRSIPTPTFIAVLSAAPLNGKMIVEIDPEVSNAIINRLFGGKNLKEKNHQITDLDNHSLMYLMKTFCLYLRDAWKEFYNFNPECISAINNPQFAQIVSPCEMGVLVTSETLIGERDINSTEGMINIFIPYMTIEKIIPLLSADNFYKKNVVRSDKVIDTQSIEIELTAKIIEEEKPLSFFKGLKVNTEILTDNEFPACKITSDYTDLLIGKVIDGKKKSVKILKPFNLNEEKLIMEKTPEVSNILNDVNITLSVELGRCKKTIKDILSLGEGSIIELDKLAGESVDVFANNVLIARGEVCVVDENFAVRIIEIVVNTK